MKLSDLSIDFVMGMVQSMYRHEADQVENLNLLTEAELMDFYFTFCARSVPGASGTSSNQQGNQ